MLCLVNVPETSRCVLEQHNLPCHVSRCEKLCQECEKERKILLKQREREQVFNQWLCNHLISSFRSYAQFPFNETRGWRKMRVERAVLNEIENVTNENLWESFGERDVVK